MLDWNIGELWKHCRKHFAISCLAVLSVLTLLFPRFICGRSVGTMATAWNRVQLEWSVYVARERERDVHSRCDAHVIITWVYVDRLWCWLNSFLIHLSFDCGSRHTKNTVVLKVVNPDVYFSTLGNATKSTREKCRHKRVVKFLLFASWRPRCTVQTQNCEHTGKEGFDVFSPCDVFSTNCVSSSSSSWFYL